MNPSDVEPSIELDFLRSSLAVDSPVFPNREVMPWIVERRAGVRTQVSCIGLESLRNWSVSPDDGTIRHSSGGFFSIEGIRVRTNWGHVPQWDQPIINQPEVGFLGFIARKFNGTLHLLVQSKIEPGNINTVQLSPTLQATRSNYLQLHRGKRPRYLEYFNGEQPVTRLLDQLQSEQGARFLRKRNRNIMVEIPADAVIEEHADFRWMTIGQLRHWMRVDNLINMDTRTVLSGLSYGTHTGRSLDALLAFVGGSARRALMLRSALSAESAMLSFREILSWITDLKSKFDLQVDRIGLRDAQGWQMRDGVVCRPDGKYFSVIGTRVEIENREVASWDQPMIRPAQEGLMAFLIRPINGVYHFLVQAKLEAGNHDVIELAPTVQCLTGNYRVGASEYSVPYIQDVLDAPASRVLYDTMQSEEGGRFFFEQNRNRIVEVGDDFPLDVHPNYRWMTLHQLHRFIEFNNYLNIAARSLIASITTTDPVQPEPAR